MDETSLIGGRSGDIGGSRRFGGGGGENAHPKKNTNKHLPMETSLQGPTVYTAFERKWGVKKKFEESARQQDHIGQKESCGL